MELCDRESVEEFFREYCNAHRPLTLAELHERIPRASNAQLLARVQIERRTRDAEIANRVCSTSGYEELIQLSPVDFAQRYLRWSSAGFSLTARLFAEQGRSVPPEMLEAQKHTRYQFQGPERLDEGTIRVCYQQIPTKVASPEAEPVNCERLRRDATGNWRLIAHAVMLEPSSPTAYIIG